MLNNSKLFDLYTRKILISFFLFLIIFTTKYPWNSTYSNDVRLSLEEIKDKPSAQPLRAIGRYGSTVSLKSLVTESSGNGNNLKCLDYNGGSLINLRDQMEVSQIRRRSPSLPPIFNKKQQQHFCQLVSSWLSIILAKSYTYSMIRIK